MPAERRLAAIMFTDIVGYTALMAESEAKGLRVRERHRAVLGPLAAEHRGEVVDENGDELVLSFSSALDSVHCALAVQNELRDDAELRLRIGIHLGDVVFEDGRVYGDGVNIAARVRPLAEPGGVCVSHAVFELVRNQPQLTISPLGRRKLKNVPDRVGIYAVNDQLGTAPTPVSVLAQPELRSIAVLPLENLGDAEHERVADGVTDALIESLARVGPELRVISRTSIMQYKGTRKTVREIAGELGVELLVEGTVLREDDEVLVRLQLIDAERDAHLWAESYEREFGGVLRLGREIARTVAAEIEIALKPQREPLLATTRPVDPEALDLYLRARTLRGSSTLVASWGPPVIELLERSVALDPDFADGWVELARAHSELGIVGLGTGSPDGIARAREAAQRALELDEHLGAAYAALGSVRLFHDWDFPGARSALERAVELSPSDPSALSGLMQYLTFVGLGASPEAELLCERLLRVAPLDISFRASRIVHFLFRREYERAVSEAERIRELDPEFIDANIPFLYFFLGRPEDAVREYRAFFAHFGATTDPIRKAFHHGSDEGGWHGGVRAVIRHGIESATEGVSGLSYVTAFHLATIGETEEAMTWLERAYEQRDPLLVNAKAEPRLDALRSDLRFQDLLRRIGFPDNG